MALALGHACRRGYSTVASLPSGTVTPSVQHLIEKTLFINAPQDWYNVPLSYLKLVKGKEVADFVKQHTSIQSIATTLYPDHKWDIAKFIQTKGKYGPQTFLERVVRSFFPDEEIRRNTKEASGIVSSKGTFLEVDIFLPRLHLGFEYQDPHHYFHSTYGAHTLAEYQSRDAEKHRQAKEKGLTIINVPFWWDWNPESLIATIKHKRPDLLKHLPSTTEPINEELPKKVVDKWDFDIPDLGAPMLALYMPQARSFDPENWWVFEKYDGMRAVWNSMKRTMYSRWGSTIPLPKYIGDYLPPFWLDGEIWFGREKNTRYQAIKITERASAAKIAWQKFMLMAFDSPQPNLLTSPYSQRYQFLEKNVPPDSLYVKVAPYTVCVGRDHLETIYFHYRAQDGEGVIVRHPDAIYINGYSRYMFKHRGYNDAEALVLEKKPYGNVYLCRIHKAHLAHNVRADAETQKEAEGETEAKERLSENEGTDTTKTAETTKPEKGKGSEFYDMEMAVDEGKFDGNSGDIEVGKFVSFYYAGELSGRGPPINPKIYSVRKDVSSWAQVLHDKQDTKPKLHQRIWKPALPVNDWTMENQRKYFNNFAQQNGFNPLIAKNWYSRMGKEIEEKEGRGLLDKYNGSMIKALLAIYPEIGLDPSKFRIVPVGYWSKAENRKKFLVEFAKEKGFDPEVADNWTSVLQSDLAKKKGAGGMLKIYGNSFKRALVDIFPNVSFKKHKFAQAPADYWKTQSNQKMLFDEFAESKKFDPLNPNNWYSVKDADLSSTKGWATVRKLHGTLAKALLFNYPNIALDETRLVRVSYAQLYDTPEKRRAFMDRFAARHKFDPNVPDNWYSVTRDLVSNTKGGASLLKRYKSSLITALFDIYPDIGLKREKFKFATKNFLKLFVDFARKKQFDPKDHRKWYSITAKDILDMPGSNLIKTIFPNLAAALLHNFPNIGLDISKLDPSLTKDLHE